MTITTSPSAIVSADGAAPLTVSAAELLSAVHLVAPAVNRRPPLPILGGVLLAASAAGLTVSAFDGDVAARTRVAVLDATDTSRTGGTDDSSSMVEAAAVVPFIALRDTLKVLGQRTAVSLSIGDGGVEVLTSTGATCLPALGEVSEYLQLPRPGGELVFSLSAAELVEGLSPVALAAYTDLTLPVLCSVQLRLRAGQAPVLNATDRHRLAEWTAPGTWGGDDASVMVLAKPFKAAAAALKRLDRHALVSVRVEEEWLHVGTDTADLSLRRVEAEYPRIEALWPAETSHSVQVDAAALAATAKRLSALIERDGAVRLDLDEDGVYLGTLDAGACERVGDRQDFDSLPPRGVAFTPKYLAECAAHFPGVVTLAGTRASGGWLISDQDSAHRSYLMAYRMGEQDQ